MKVYLIHDLKEKIMLSAIKEVNAKSPLEAVKKIYPTARRVYEGGHIVVRCRNGRGSWVYDTEEL